MSSCVYSAERLPCTPNRNAWTNNIQQIFSSATISRQEDASEFLIALLSSLHRLAKPIPLNIAPLEQQTHIAQSALRPQHQHQHQHQQQFTSWVTDLCQVKLRSYITCCGCNKQRVSGEEPLLGVLPLPADHNTSTLNSSMRQLTEVERLVGDNKVFCETCKKTCEAEKFLRLYTLPQLLVMQFKRFTHNSQTGKTTKLMQLITFPFEWTEEDLAHFCYDCVPCGYTLTGVVAHIGNSTNSGHYIAYIKGNGDRWFKQDDAKSTTVSSRQASLVSHIVAQRWGSSEHQHRPMATQASKP